MDKAKYTLITSRDCDVILRVRRNSHWVLLKYLQLLNVIGGT